MHLYYLIHHFIFLDADMLNSFLNLISISIKEKKKFIVDNL